MFLISFLLVLASTLWAYIALRGMGGPVILHFNETRGITLMGSFWEVVGIGVTGLVMTLINFMLVLALEEWDSFLGRFLTITTAILAALIFIGMVAIIAVN